MEATAAKRPQLPLNFFKFQPLARLKAIQQFISSYEYKQSPLTSFNSHKVRPLARIMDTAKLMVYEPQPIKCVEAVFLALYLTAGMHDVDRIPLSFKTEEESKVVHQHIVLLVRFGGKYGAFGISRRPELMNKDFEFDSISKVIENYISAYQAYLHKVLKIRIGLPVEHNVDSYNFICWRYLRIMPQETPWNECCVEIEKHGLQGKRLWEKWLADGQGHGKVPKTALRCYSRPICKKVAEEAIRITTTTTIYTKQKMKNENASDKLEVGSTITAGSNTSSQQRGKLRRRRRVTFVAARLKSSRSNLVALKGRTIELLSARDESELIAKRGQFNGGLLRSPGKVTRKICPLVPCRVVIASFG